MPSLHFRDQFGTVVIPSVAPTFGNWVPDVEEIGDRQTGLGTGTEYVFGFRTDYTVSLEMTNIPAASLNDLARLKRHLVGGQTGTGGLVTVFTDDAASRVYTCSLKPGTTPEWTLSDRTNLEYTLTLSLRHVAPVFMVCDYTAHKGPDQNLIVNGGGETGTVGQAAPGWSNFLNASVLLVDDGDAFFDARALLHDNALQSQQHSAQTITPTVGQRYLFSGWTQLVAGAVGDVAVLRLFAPGGNTMMVWRYGAMADARDVGITVPPSGSPVDWTYVASLIDVTGAGNLSPLLRTATTTSAIARYDGIRLVPVPAS